MMLMYHIALLGFYLKIYAAVNILLHLIPGQGSIFLHLSEFKVDVLFNLNHLLEI